MFLDNLSTSVLKLCDTRRLSYEAAAERCDLSSRYFGDIARGKTAPTILTLEKLCVGFALTPNDLLIPSEVWSEMAFREPMPVTHIRCFRYLSGVTGFPVCPQCGKTMEREYQPYCDRCGQCLDWDNFLFADFVHRAIDGLPVRRLPARERTLRHLLPPLRQRSPSAQGRAF